MGFYSCSKCTGRFISNKQPEKFWNSIKDVLDMADVNERIIMYGDLNGWVVTRWANYKAALALFGSR